MKTINIADGLFITYEDCNTIAGIVAHECLIHMTGSMEDIGHCMTALDALDIDSDSVTLQIYCQEHLDGYHNKPDMSCNFPEVVDIEAVMTYFQGCLDAGEKIDKAFLKELGEIA